MEFLAHFVSGTVLFFSGLILIFIITLAIFLLIFLFFVLRDVFKGNFITRLRFIFSDAFLDLFRFADEVDDQE